MKKNKIGCDLESCFLCTRCLPEWKPAIAGHRDSYHISKGETIFTEGDRVQGIYFICSGKVKVHKQWGAEKELILRIAGTGDLVGHRELQESERKMRNLAHMQVKGRIARALMELREKFGLTQEGFIDIALSRQDLASFAGTT